MATVSFKMWVFLADMEVERGLVFTELIVYSNYNCCPIKLYLSIYFLLNSTVVNFLSRRSHSKMCPIWWLDLNGPQGAYSENK